MSFFTKKTWKDRRAEFINRRTLTKEDGSEEVVTVARNEGNISEEGDAFNSDTMNDLEERVEAGFNGVNESLNNKQAKISLAENKAVVTSSNGNLMASNVTRAELEHISGIESNFGFNNMDNESLTLKNGTYTALQYKGSNISTSNTGTFLIIATPQTSSAADCGAVFLAKIDSTASNSYVVPCLSGAGAVPTMRVNANGTLQVTTPNTAGACICRDTRLTVL